MADTIWQGGARSTIPGLLEHRLEANPDGPYLDVCGRAFTAREVDERARRIASALVDLGIRKGDRVASLAPNRAHFSLVVRGSGLGRPLRVCDRCVLVTGGHSIGDHSD